MKNSIIVSTFVGITFFCGVQAQEPSNPILEERLRNAQVKEITFGNGATIKEYKFAGSLQPNFDIGCIAIEEVTSALNAPALFYAAKKCISENRYLEASQLLNTGNAFAYFDLKRLADRSTHGARTVVVRNALAEITQNQRMTLAGVSGYMLRDPGRVQAYCVQLKRIGPPTYEPMWAILHGIGVYDEPRDGHYLTNADMNGVWEEVLQKRCTPTNS